MSCLSKDSFGSSSQTVYFLFPVLIFALHRTASIRLNKSGERRHSCLASSPREKASSFLPLSIVLAG